MRSRCPEGRQALERYATGLLTDLPNKNGDTMAQVVPTTNEQRWQEFLANMDWDEGDLNRQRVQPHIQWLTEELASLDQALGKRVQQSPFWPAKEDLMRTLQAIGPVVAITVLAELPALGALNRKEIAAPESFLSRAFYQRLLVGGLPGQAADYAQAWSFI